MIFLFLHDMQTMLACYLEIDRHRRQRREASVGTDRGRRPGFLYVKDYAVGYCNCWELA